MFFVPFSHTLLIFRYTTPHASLTPVCLFHYTDCHAFSFSSFPTLECKEWRLCLSISLCLFRSTTPHKTLRSSSTITYITDHYLFPCSHCYAFSVSSLTIQKQRLFFPFSINVTLPQRHIQDDHCLFVSFLHRFFLHLLPNFKCKRNGVCFHYSFMSLLPHNVNYTTEGVKKENKKRRKRKDIMEGRRKI